SARCGRSSNEPRLPRFRHRRRPGPAAAGDGLLHRAHGPRPARAGPGAGAGRVLRQRDDPAAEHRHPHRQRAVLRGGAGDRPARLRQHHGGVEVPDARRGDRMNHLASLPAWAAVVVGVLALLGALLALVGSVGLLRLRNFYQRVHAPTLGSTLGTFLMVAASITCFSVLHGRLVLHEMLIGGFLTVTTPITLMLLVRAALHRDREAGSEHVPRSPR